MHIIPSSIAFCERAYSKPNAIKSPLATSLIGLFGYSDTSTFMRERVGKNGLEGNILVMARHEKYENSWFGIKSVRSLNFYAFILEKIKYF